MTDKPQSLDDLLQATKRCPNCGHANRLTAKVCVNCGYRFPPESIQPDETAGVASDAANATKPPSKPIRAKTCPECGTVNDLDAKFCPNCGHRFTTDFSRSTVKPTAVPTKSAPPGEPPIVQMPSTGTVLVTPTPPPPVILPPPVAVPPSQAAAPAPLPPDPADSADDGIDGAPAPDLTDVDLDRLRRRDRRF